MTFISRVSLYVVVLVVSCLQFHDAVPHRPLTLRGVSSSPLFSYACISLFLCHAQKLRQQTNKLAMACGPRDVLRQLRSCHLLHNCLNKKLSYRRGTARHAMLVNLCYVSRDMGVRKVSNSNSDLQGHLRALAMVPFGRPHTISY